MSGHQGRAETEFNPQEHISRLGAGSVLVARDLADPNFTSTVVLLCQHGEEGSYGLVLNRPAHMPFSEVFENFSELLDVPGGLGQALEIHIGGPVQGEELQVLQVTDIPAEGALEVVPGVFLGGKWDNLRDLLNNKDSGIRLFLGYSGWGAEQLAYEISMKAWEVWQVDVAKVLSGPHTALMGDASQIKSFLMALQE